jgi:hypothetical protein
VDLEAAHQVMSQNGELQPRTIGAVMIGRDRVECEFAFELGEGCARRSLGKEDGMT